MEMALWLTSLPYVAKQNRSQEEREAGIAVLWAELAGYFCSSCCHIQLPSVGTTEADTSEDRKTGVWLGQHQLMPMPLLAEPCNFLYPTLMSDPCRWRRNSCL